MHQQDEEDCGQYAAGQTEGCAGDPVQYPECLDVAVVLPELLRAFPGRFRAGIPAVEMEPAVFAETPMLRPLPVASSRPM